MLCCAVLGHSRESPLHALLEAAHVEAAEGARPEHAEGRRHQHRHARHGRQPQACHVARDSSGFLRLSGGVSEGAQADVVVSDKICMHMTCLRDGFSSPLHPQDSVLRCDVGLTGEDGEGAAGGDDIQDEEQVQQGVALAHHHARTTGRQAPHTARSMDLQTDPAAALSP